MALELESLLVLLAVAVAEVLLLVLTLLVPFDVGFVATRSQDGHMVKVVAGNCM